jgi:hypothetical protein
MIAQLGFLVLVGVMLWLAWSTIRPARPQGSDEEPPPQRVRPLRPKLRPPKRAGTPDWEPKSRQVARKVKGVVPETSADRDAIVAFIDSREGVEAFMEPKTAMFPLSVVLVAEDGEWKRFALPDDSTMRDLARTKDLAVYDATRVGYPERMRRYNKEHRQKDPEA